jgi:phosphoglycolate phosphatase
MHAKKVIMFDFDGVIADSLADQTRVFIDTLRTHGLHELAQPSTLLDFTETNWFDALVRAEVPAHVVEEIELAFGAAPQPELFPGMAGVLETLATANPVVVITSSRTEPVARTLKERGVRGVADIIGGDMDPSKTSKIRSVRRRFGESLESWYVCDTVGDVVEAQAAGAGTVGVAWGWHGEERLLGAGPDRIVRRPTDLLDLF